jgi:hypothetical protein
MNSGKYAVLIWAFLLGTAAVAGDQQRTRIAIDIDDGTSGERAFRFDSEDAGFALGSLAIGESRTWADDSGNVASIMRTAEGFEIDVAGETIVIDDLDVTAAIDESVRVDEVREIRMIRKDGDADDITILSAQPIDEATRQRVREALQGSGDTVEVVFIDASESGAHSEHHAEDHHQVRIIRKKSDAAN